jgi:hypothetical protein
MHKRLYILAEIRCGNLRYETKVWGGVNLLDISSHPCNAQVKYYILVAHPRLRGFDLRLA